MPYKLRVKVCGTLSMLIWVSNITYERYQSDSFDIGSTIDETSWGHLYVDILFG